MTRHGFTAIFQFQHLLNSLGSEEGESAMKLDATKLGLATAIVSAVLWAICSLLVAAVPAGMMSMSGSMMHADMGNMRWTLTAAGFLTGLVVWSVLSGVVVWAVAALYNRLLG